MSKPIGDVNLPGSRTLDHIADPSLCLCLTRSHQFYRASLVRPGSFLLQS